MKSILGLAAAACLLVGLTAERASADILSYEAVVSGTFKKGGTSAGSFNGSFVYTNTGGVLQLISASITTSVDAVTLVGWNQLYVYGASDPSLNTATLDTLTVDQLKLVADDFWLDLRFDPNLLHLGTTTVTASNSKEHPDSGGNRNVNMGTGNITLTQVPAVPEPSTIAVVAICAPALLVYAQRRRRQGADAA